MDPQLGERNHETYSINTSLQYMITINPLYEEIQPEQPDNDQVLCASKGTLKLKIKDGTKWHSTQKAV